MLTLFDGLHQIASIIFIKDRGCLQIRAVKLLLDFFIDFSIHNRNQFQIFLNIGVCDILFFSVLREKDYPAVIFALRFTDAPCIPYRL